MLFEHYMNITSNTPSPQDEDIKGLQTILALMHTISFKSREDSSPVHQNIDVVPFNTKESGHSLQLSYASGFSLDDQLNGYLPEGSPFAIDTEVTISWRESMR